MDKQEFLFEHNYDQIVDLINRHFTFHGATTNEKKDDDDVDETGKSAREFFSF